MLTLLLVTMTVYLFVGLTLVILSEAVDARKPPPPEDVATLLDLLCLFLVGPAILAVLSLRWIAVYIQTFYFGTQHKLDEPELEDNSTRPNPLGIMQTPPCVLCSDKECNCEDEPEINYQYVDDEGQSKDVA